MKVIENKDCRVITTTQQGLVLVEDSGVIIQIDQQVILKAAENLGLLNYNIVRESDEVEKLATQLESALATCNKADKTIKELRKQIDVDNNVINELTFQRDGYKDSVVQLEKQLNAALTKLEEQPKYKDMLDRANSVIKENDKTISKLSQEIKNYEETGAYILRYVITDGNIIMDNARVHEPIICADPETAATALRNLCNGTDYAAVFKCCDTSRYNIGFNSESYVISCLDSHDRIDIYNRPIAYNLYNLLRLGSITISDIRELIGKKK